MITFEGHERPVIPILFVPAKQDGVEMTSYDESGLKGLLLSGSADNTVRSWSLKVKKGVKTFKGESHEIFSW